MSNVSISALAVTTQTRGDKVLGVKDGAARQFGAGPSFEQLGDAGGSAMIGHAARGAGAVARSVQSRLGDTVCVFDFLTAEQIADVQACTKLLDVTAGIQAAVDWAVYGGAAGGPAISSVYMPSGVYKTSNTIHLGYGNQFKSVQLRGDGMRYRGEAGFAGTAIVPTFNDRPAIAVRWIIPFVEPPIASSTRSAFSKDFSVRIRSGVSLLRASSMAVLPDFSAMRMRSAVTAGADALPGKAIPSASATHAIVLAVPITEQVPTLATS